MKKNVIGLIGTTLAFSLLVGSIFVSTKTVSEIAKADTYTQTAAEYYSGFDWDKKEATLKTNLFNKIKITQAGWSYDGLFTAYQTTDTRSDGTVWDLYSDKTKYTHSSSHNYSQEGDGFNREHMIPQSIFSENAPMKSDIHHVFPTDGYVNNRRSNYPHGNVNKNTTYTSNDGYKLGYTNDGNYSGLVFEVKDEYKGDVARTYFYFVTCYQNKLADFKSFDAFDKQTYPSIAEPFLSVYLDWAKNDPVSQKEIDRNNAAYAGQGNRNPFIDCPYAVGAIWDYDHASDYGTKGEIITVPPGTIGITSISRTTASITVGNSTTISATSSNGANVSWSSSNPSVATVSTASATSGANVTITGVATGSATITASVTISGQTYSKTCAVTVSTPKTLSSISVSGQKTSFKVGDAFSFGGTVTAHYTDSTTANVTASASFSGYNMSTTGNQTVTVSYTEGTTKTTTYSITISENTGTNSETIVMSEQGFSNAQAVTTINGSNCSISFDKGSNSNSPKYYDSGSSVRAYGGNTLTITSSETIVGISFTFGTGEDSNAITTNKGTFTSPNWTGSANSVTFTIASGSGNRRFASITITYESSGSSTPTSITATVNKTYYVGDTITKSDITVKDDLNNTITDFTFSNYQFTYADAASGGSLTNKTLTNAISYNNMQCSLTTQVQRKARVDTSNHTYSISYTDLPTAYSTSTDERTAASGVKFVAYNCANYSSKMQFKASGGYIQTTQELSLKKLTINNRETNTLSVMGGTSSSSVSTSISGTNDVYNLTGYKYVKVIRSSSNAAYCSSIDIEVGVSDTAANLANYIMYTDTSNQCTTKFSTAKGYFEGLSSSERSTFMTSSNYVISTARTRLQAWAAHEGKTISYSGGDYVISSTRNVQLLSNNINSNVLVSLIIVVSVVGVSSVCGYYLLKRKKER